MKSALLITLITLLKVIWETASYSWSRDAVVGIQNNASTGSTKYINEDLVNTTSSPLIVRYNLNVTSNVGTCITNQTLNVLVKPDPEVTSSLRVNVCHGETLNYQITSGVANTSFNWAQNQNINVNSGATSSANNSSTITQLFENDSTIEQTVTYDITGTYDGCRSDISIKLLYLQNLFLFRQMI